MTLRDVQHITDLICRLLRLDSIPVRIDYSVFVARADRNRNLIIVNPRHPLFRNFGMLIAILAHGHHFLRGGTESATDENSGAVLRYFNIPVEAVLNDIVSLPKDAAHDAGDVRAEGAAVRV